MGTSFSFAVELDFGKNYIGKFEIKVKINKIHKKYFDSTGISNDFKFDFNPAFLSLVERE